MTFPVHHIQFEDGSLVHQEEPPINVNVNVVTVLEGQVVPVGVALATLLAQAARWRHRAEQAETRLADIQSYCHANHIDLPPSGGDAAA